jgi:hypothetical protein
VAYTAHEPKRPSSDELRARIPGWGADLDPNDRPSVPQETFDPSITKARWDFPERQPEKWPRERSIEHQFLTPVFGTSTPPKGLSGVMRRYAYTYSEARTAHWLLLIAADRVDAIESHLASLLTTHPDNPITQTGIKSEFTHHGYRSRIGRKRVDLAHTWIDPLLVAGPWVLAGGLGVLTMKSVVRQCHRQGR